MGIETIVYCAIAVCGFAALQGVIWAYYSRRPQIEGSYAALALTIAIFLYTSLPTLHGPVADIIVGLKQGTAILMMPLFLYFLSEISNKPLPVWLTRSFNFSAAGLFIACLLGPHNLAVASITVDDPTDLRVDTIGYLSPSGDELAGLFGAYFFWGFGLIVWVGSRLYRDNHRFDALVLGGFIAVQLLLAAWSVVIAGQIITTYMAGGVFMVIILIVSIRSGIERKEMAKQIQRQQRTSALERMQRHNLELSLKDAAYTDHLTGLPNRLRLLEKLEALNSRPNECNYSLYLFGIRHFKDVNYSFGPPAGDEVLRQAAARLERFCEGAALIARVAGDVFAVLLKDTPSTSDHPETLDSDNDYKSILKKLCLLYNIDNNNIKLDYVVGAVRADANSNIDNANSNIENANSNVVSANKWLIDAEYALQVAKTRPEDSIVIYDDSLRKAQEREIRMMTALRSAHTKGELALAYQLKVRWDHKIVGMEALLRWNSKEFGAVSPEEFIPLAERYGFIGSLGQWVALKTCQQVSDWLGRGLKPGRVSFNVGPGQLIGGTFSELLLAFMKKFTLDPCHIEVEITETAYMENFEQAKLEIGILRAAGIHVSIDDFGTGYSSLARLGQLPFDSIKLDKGFVDNILCDEGAEIVRSIIGVAKAFNCSIVAEGVESKQHIDVLLELGCDTFQGYYFSKPLSPEKVGKILSSPDFDSTAQSQDSEAPYPAWNAATPPWPGLDTSH